MGGSAAPATSRRDWIAAAGRARGARAARGRAAAAGRRARRSGSPPSADWSAPPPPDWTLTHTGAGRMRGGSMAHHDFQTRVLVRSEESGGHVAFVENASPPAGRGRRCITTTSTRRSTCSRASSPSRSATQRFTRRAGELAFAPRDVPHTLAERSGAQRALPARLHAGRLRALLRPHRRGAGRRRAAASGAGPDPRDDRRRSADRRRLGAGVDPVAAARPHQRPRCAAPTAPATWR